MFRIFCQRQSLMILERKLTRAMQSRNFRYPLLAIPALGTWRKLCMLEIIGSIRKNNGMN